jgi:hypothetical protein
VIPAKASPLVETQMHVERIYYRVPRVNPDQVHTISTAETTKRLGIGSLITKPPALGTTPAHTNLNLTIVSKPSRPDNFRQTIYQPNSPPDLKITTEQKLPDIVLGHPVKLPKAPLNPSEARPIETKRKTTEIEAPVINSNANTADLFKVLPKTANPHPSLPIPISGGGAPIARSRPSQESGSGNADSNGEGLLAISVDPSNASDQIALPAGNRWGEFSIARPADAAGSPGGDPSGVAGGGSGGEGPGGEGTAGNGSAGPISVRGRGNNGGQEGMLDSALISSMVYPVALPPLNLRKNSLIVSAGPIGGGGLNVYGALSCGKIYTVFLPMPGKNWSLQYCARAAGTHEARSKVSSTFVRLEDPLVAPDADLAHRFDFKRVPVPVEKSHRAIVLKGVIAADGSVERLAVYQGVVPEMDEAAKLAFSRWQFKPAMKAGKPVEVEILVGIPPTEGEDRISR